MGTGNKGHALYNSACDSSPIGTGILLMHVCFILGAKASSLNPWFLHTLGYETPKITLRPQYSLCQEQHGHSSESFAFLRCKTGGKQGDNQGEVLNCDIKIVMLACPASYKKKQFSQRSGCTWHWQPRPPAETPMQDGELTLRAVGVTQSTRPFNTTRWHDAKSEVISPGKSKEGLMGKLEIGTTFSLLCWFFFFPRKLNIKRLKKKETYEKCQSCLAQTND